MAASPYDPSPFDPTSQHLPTGPPTAAQPGPAPTGWAGAPPQWPPYSTPTNWNQPWPPAGPPRPPQKPAKSHGGLIVAAVVLTLLLFGAFFAGAKMPRLGSSPIAAQPATPASPRQGGSSSPTPSDPNSSSNGSPNSSSGSSSGGSSSLNDVINAIDPGVVDIVSQLPEGVGAGTGMVLTADGEILTNNHVVAGAEQIQVTVTATGDTYDATVVGTNPSEDVAVIKMSGASGLATIPIGDSDTVKQGDPIVAIGNAGGRGGTPIAVTGTVTALHQQITASESDGANAQTLADTIQINANIQPGDSGGPLVDADAKVIGMDSAASASGGGGGRRRTTTHEGFAIPINKALSVAKQLEANPNGGGGNGSSSSSKKALLGVQVETSTQEGASVVGVQAKSPAANAGLQAGDLITGVDQAAVSSANDLTTVLESHQPGDSITITWEASDGEHQQSVTLGTR
jgi:S1-C subfamily serine protease